MRYTRVCYWTHSLRPGYKSRWALIAFIILTALGFAIHKIGWDYLRSPHSEIVKFEIKPMQEDKGI